MWRYIKILLELELARLTGVVYGKEEKERIVGMLKGAIKECIAKDDELGTLLDRVDKIDCGECDNKIITGDCGHMVYANTKPVSIADYDEPGNRCVSRKMLCPDCCLVEDRAGMVLEGKVAETNWIKFGVPCGMPDDEPDL